MGFRRPDPAGRHLPATAAGAGAVGRAAARRASPASRSREAAPAAAEPRVWPVLARPRRVRVGREPALIAHSGRPARALARPPRPGAPAAAAAPSRLAGSQRAARRRGGTPSPTARPAAGGWLWARVHPGRLVAWGPQRLSSSETPGPAHRTPGARLPGGHANSEGPRGAAATRPGPGSCHFRQPPTSERAGRN